MKLPGRKKEENAQDSIHFLNTAWYLRKGSVMIAHSWNRWRESEKHNYLGGNNTVHSPNIPQRNPLCKETLIIPPLPTHLQLSPAASVLHLVQANPAEGTAAIKPSLLIFCWGKKVLVAKATCLLCAYRGGGGLMNLGVEVTRRIWEKSLQTHLSRVKSILHYPKFIKANQCLRFLLSPECVICLLCYRS